MRPPAADPSLAWDGRAPLRGPYASITWRATDLKQVGAAAERLQAALRPGGWLLVEPTRGARRVAKALRPFFEGGVLQRGQRFNPVRARKDAAGPYVLAFRRGPGLDIGHFDTLGDDYEAEMPPHLVAHYLEQKVRRVVAAGAKGRGLEVGCGLGPYAKAIGQRLGEDIVAMDRSAPMLRAGGRKGTMTAVVGDALDLPFKDASFDFAYTVNMVHHLKRGEQRLALAELERVVKPGAPVLVFEINVRNPLFRFYMRQVFPRTRRIDRGDEEFLDARRLPVPDGLLVEQTDYYTFVPDFVPRWSLRPLRAFERLMERSWLRVYSIHYTVTLRRR